VHLGLGIPLKFLSTSSVQELNSQFSHPMNLIRITGQLTSTTWARIILTLQTKKDLQRTQIGLSINQLHCPVEVLWWPVLPTRLYSPYVCQIIDLYLRFFSVASNRDLTRKKYRFFCPIFSHVTLLWVCVPHFIKKT